jgi:hypothetical protein
MYNKTLESKIFYRFLKKNHCLQSFAWNTITCRESSNKYSIGDFGKKNILGTLAKLYSISNAFTWDKTKEGWGYWNKLTKKLYIERDKIIRDIHILKPR